MNLRQRRPVVAIAIGVVLAVALPLLPAVGLHSFSRPRAVMTIQPQARWVSNGAGVVLRVRIACSSSSRYVDGPYAEVIQSRVVDVARGWGSGREPRCHGGFERRRILITAEQRPFIPGRAIARASLYVCSRHRCDDVEVQREVMILPTLQDLVPVAG